MNIVTYEAEGTISAMTREEYNHALAKDPIFHFTWDEWVWQEQPSKEAAIARHNEAFAAWEAHEEAGLPPKATF